MATLQNRNGRWRAMVRRMVHKGQYRTFPTKTAAETWSERIECEQADYEALGGTPRREPDHRPADRLADR